MAEIISAEIANSSEGLAAIVVTYNPNTLKLLAHLLSLEKAVDQIIVSDNSTDLRAVDVIESGSLSRGYHYIDNNGNVGIAEAQNRAVKRAAELGCSSVIFLDDDSNISPQSIEQLVRAHKSAWASSSSVVAVGPVIRDARSNEALVFRWEGWRLRRFEGPYGRDPVEVAFMLSSGTLMTVQNFEAVGQFRNDYFIDHVDLEWGIRASSMGHKLFVIPNAEMVHSLGDAVQSSVGKNANRYLHTSHVRDYYLARNMVLLIREAKLVKMRKMGLLLRLARDLGRTILLPDRSWQKLSHQMVGLWHGLSGKSGVYRPARKIG